MENLEQAYKDRITGVFSRSAELYDQIGPKFFSHYGNRVVAHANIAPGTAVLDIACGRGALLFPAQKKVGQSGRVIGIDLAEGMVAQTRGDIANLGVENVAVLHMDAEKLQFQAESFDVVLCGFALFFFPNLELALAEIYRVLKPNGVFAISTFGDLDERWEKVRELNRSYYKRIHSGPEVETNSLNSRQILEETLSTAGFRKIEIVAEELEIYYQDEKEWWAAGWTHGFRGFLEMLDEKTLRAYQSEVFQALREIKDEQGIPDSVQVLLTRAIRPGSD